MVRFLFFFFIFFLLLFSVFVSSISCLPSVHVYFRRLRSTKGRQRPDCTLLNVHVDYSLFLRARARDACGYFVLFVVTLILARVLQRCSAITLSVSVVIFWMCTLEKWRDETIERGGVGGGGRQDPLPPRLFSSLIGSSTPEALRKIQDVAPRVVVLL